MVELRAPFSTIPQTMESQPRLRFTDYLLVGVFCAMLFGYAAFSGRPLTMHEARLPETSREMLRTHGWLLPTSGGRPWLERPPLPHWIVTATMRLLGHDDRVWVVRLPSGLMGLITVLLTMWMAGRFFGRDIGVLSGLILATCFEFYSYSCLAEDDIYLGALVAIAAALFCRTGISPVARQGRDARVTKSLRWFDFFTFRSPAMLGFFFVLGLTNITKGPLLGLVILGISVGVFLLWQSITARSLQPILQFTWLWGWLITIALTLAWPMWAYHRYPDVVDNWRYDYLGRVSGTYTDINEAWYYYLPTTATSLMPWTPACLIGLMATVRGLVETSKRSTPMGKRSTLDVELPTSKEEPASSTDVERRALNVERLPSSEVERLPSSAIRFVWCWAIVPLLVLSIPKGKHHHYLVPLIAPWAVLGAVGVREVGRFLFRHRGPNWWRDPKVGMLALGVPGAVALLVLHARIPEPVVITAGLGLFWIAVVGCIQFAVQQRRGGLLMGTAVVALLAGYSWAQTMVAGGTDHTFDDTAFLDRARIEVPGDMPLFINGKLGPAGNLDFFRCQFYSRADAILLHNLSYLRDENIKETIVYVITRARDEKKLRLLGTPTLIDQSPDSHNLPGPDGRFSLFRLKFDPRLTRYPVPPKVTSLQAMERADGPWCGPRM